MGNILFQSDYGLGNGTAELSGICLQVDPALQIYTLSHDVPRLDVTAAAANLAAVTPCWPAGTVLVSLVDPAVGTEHRICAARTTGGCYLLTADNGALAPLKGSIDQVRDIGPLLREYPFPAAAALLHGKDLAWAAALLASGQRPFEVLGECYPVEEIKELDR
ncbi:MAG: SAM-dependent chlorinase/fluorinase [Candidatus Onthomonas sp.]